MTGRFINADGYVSTGQGVLGNNMFTYCGNNPINLVDPSGQFFLAALIVTAVVATCAVVLSGCSAEKDLPYNSADDAARAFSEEIYSASLYIRHEFSTEIYSRTVNGTTTYGYNKPRAGKPHSSSVGAATPEGTEMVAYAHTHHLWGHVSAKPIDLVFRQWYNEYNKTSERLEAQGKPKDEK